jgi:hypothetical protein
MPNVIGPYKKASSSKLGRKYDYMACSAMRGLQNNWSKNLTFLKLKNPTYWLVQEMDRSTKYPHLTYSGNWNLTPFACPSTLDYDNQS